MFDTGILGSAYRRRCLLKLFDTVFPKIGDQEDAIGAFERSLESFWPVQVSYDDFLGQFTMLAWIARQSTHLELPAGLQGAYNSAALLPSCTEYRDHFFAVV